MNYGNGNGYDSDVSDVNDNGYNYDVYGGNCYGYGNGYNSDGDNQWPDEDCYDNGYDYDDSHFFCIKCPNITVSSVESPYCARCLADLLAEKENPTADSEANPTPKEIEAVFDELSKWSEENNNDLEANELRATISFLVGNEVDFTGAGNIFPRPCQGNVNCTELTDAEDHICMLCKISDFQRSCAYSNSDDKEDLGKEDLGNNNIYENVNVDGKTMCAHCERQLAMRPPPPCVYLCSGCFVTNSYRLIAAAERDAKAAEAESNAAGNKDLGNAEESQCMICKEAPATEKRVVFPWQNDRDCYYYDHKNIMHVCIPCAAIYDEEHYACIVDEV